MRHRLRALAHVAALLAALLACKGGSKASKGDDSPGAAPDEKAIPVKVADLLAEYHGNEVRGDAKYKGKVVDAVGFVGDIKKDFTDSAYITLLPTPGAFELNAVHCNLADGQDGPAAKLNKGEAVILRGRVQGLVVGSVIIRECKVGKRGVDLPDQPKPAPTPAPRKK